MKTETHRTAGSSNMRSTLRVSTARNGRLGSAAMQTSLIVFEALCFGDFHLGQQMKVTAGRARPAGCCKVNKPRNHESKALVKTPFISSS
jgi:hypothetical protein